MLEMAILGLLKDHPMHGYDLRKRLRSEFGLLSSLSFGSLYPALGRLEADGAVRELLGAQPAWSRQNEAIPLSGSLTGERAAFRARLAARTTTAARQAGGTRARKVYEITDRGRALFDQLLAEETPRHEDGRAFAVRWAFASYLSPDARVRLLDRRRRELDDRLTVARRALESPPRQLDRFERSLAEHNLAMVKLDLEWIDRLLVAEHTAPLVAPAHGPDSHAEQPQSESPTAVATSVTRSTS